jgi:hypothetical protein
MVLMTKNLKIFTADKKWIFFGSNVAIYLSLGLHKGSQKCFYVDDS